MSRYNLLHTSNISSNIVSGANMSLTSSDITRLLDSNLSTYVTITSGTNILQLDIDLNNRILLYNINIKLSSAIDNSLISNNHLKVYYKNEVSDSYTQAAISYSDGFIINSPDSLSPRYFKITVSGLSCNLQEVAIYNEDSLVRYGNEGELESKSINLVDDVYTVPIYNNSDDVVVAYTTFDLLNSTSGIEYVSISSNSTGDFKSIYDGIKVGGSDSYNLDWNAGKFDLTYINDDGHVSPVVLTNILGFTRDKFGSIQGSNTFHNNDHTIVRTGYPQYTNTYLPVVSWSPIKIPMFSGKWYVEFKSVQHYDGTFGDPIVGLAIYTGYQSSGYSSGMNWDVTLVSQTNDVVGIALDTDSGKYWYSLNGVWNGSPASGTGAHASDLLSVMNSNNCRYLKFGAATSYGQSGGSGALGTGDTITINTGDSAFYYTVPSGFLPLVNIFDSGRTRYTTPIINFEDKNLATQLYSSVTSYSGSRVSKDISSPYDIIEVRSSDVTPIAYESLFETHIYTNGSNLYGRIGSYNINRLQEFSSLANPLNSTTSTPYLPVGTICNNKYGYVYSIFLKSSNTVNIYVYDTFNTSPSVIYTKSNAVDYSFDYDAQSTGAGSIWGYSSFYGYLHHVGADLSSIYILDYGTHFISGLSADLKGSGVWYVDKLAKQLVHLSSSGSVIFSTVLISPKDVACANDDGCWANDGKIVYNYDYYGNVLSSITMSNNVHIMCPDIKGGFWCICTDGYLYNVTSSGDIRVKTSCGYINSDISSGPTAFNYFNIRNMVLRSTSDHVYVYKNYSKVIEIYNYYSGNLIKTYSINTSGATYPIASYPGVFYINHSNCSTYNLGKVWESGYSPTISGVFPAINDSIWGPNGSLSWKNINIDTGFLSKNAYQQFRYTFETTNINSNRAVLSSLEIPPAIETPDLAPNTSKDIYIQTSFPDSLAAKTCSIKLKTWWWE